jgi:methylmalonyl-CoA mutase N-terminal domain/subunit
VDDAPVRRLRLRRGHQPRYKFLLSRGQTGLSVAFDLPTLMGRDADDPWAAGEVGKCGVSISSLEDMQTLFDGIPLADVSTSMTINSPAAIIWAMYIVAAEKQGADIAGCSPARCRTTSSRSSSPRRSSSSRPSRR